jgi:hypothetical protein
MSRQDELTLLNDCYSNINLTVQFKLIDMLGEPLNEDHRVKYNEVKKTLVQLIIENLNEEYGYGNN